jgi:hypothetical protein
LQTENARGPEILVPVEFLSLDAEAERVRIATLSVAQLAGVPAFDSHQLGPDQENQILEYFMPGEDGDFYSHPRFDPRAFLSASDQVRD